MTVDLDYDADITPCDHLGRQVGHGYLGLATGPATHLSVLVSGGGFDAEHVVLTPAQAREVAARLVAAADRIDVGP